MLAWRCKAGNLAGPDGETIRPEREKETMKGLIAVIIGGICGYFGGWRGLLCLIVGMIWGIVIMAWKS